ncbi:MAG: radical SAM protein [Bacteroidetes bacterium]|nr:radical SAM protein [Bacteroidota bacterium]
MIESVEQNLKNGKLLPLMEEFYTIQGEGFHTGKPAYFVRIGGCDVGCSWCDTKRSWNAELHPAVLADDIVKRAVATPGKAVVVTGGEPSMYELGYFTAELHKNQILTFIETSGAHKLSGEWDWICLSPKRQIPPKKEIFKKAHELKMIVQTEADIAWAEENSLKVSEHCELYLQPEWSVAPKILPIIIEYAKNNPKWKISLQSHKYMKIP